MNNVMTPNSLIKHLLIGGLLLTGLSAYGGSVFRGHIDLVEIYAPGVNGSGALCYVRVPATNITSTPSCAGASGYYHYSWECEYPRRKQYLSLALSAYLTGKKGCLEGNG